MQLHEQVAALVEQLGPSVLDDADGLRGALDDFLDEDAASTGDLNLLVDAVRLGAYRGFVDMVDSGAAVVPALDEAGSRLARDRGSADVVGCSWALSVLGFAAGRVSEADVTYYGSRHVRPHSTGAPSRPVPPEATTPPGAPSQPSQPSQPTSWASQPTSWASQPTSWASEPTSWPSSQMPGSPPASSVPAATSRPVPAGAQSWGAPGVSVGTGASGGKRTGLIIGIVVAVLVVVGGGAFLALRGGGDDKRASDDPSQGGSQTTTEATTDPTGDTTVENTPVPVGVCTDDANGYTEALDTFSPRYAAASDRLLAGNSRKDFSETLAGAFDMRATIYDFDADVRALDLAAVQPSVNQLLTVNGEMIAQLDDLQNTTTSAQAVSAVADLPTDRFITAFTDLGDEIAANTVSC